MAKRGMGAAVAIGGLALVGIGLAAAGRRRDRVPVPQGERSGGMCGDPPSVAARYATDTRLRGWVNCPGRTAVEVGQLGSALRAAGRTREAGMVGSVWNARRRVEDARPDAAAASAETRAVAEAAATGPAPADVPADPSAPLPSDGSTSEGTAGRAPRAFDPSESRTFDPARARAGAASIARLLRHSTPAQYAGRLADWQELAGLATDGRYGGMTYNALRYFGIQNPPPAHTGPRPDDPRALYAPSSTRSIAAV